MLGAVTLGARVIERHFTDSNDREGPDHKFAMNPRELGRDGCRDPPAGARPGLSRINSSPTTRVQTAVVQRRCLRAARDIKAGEIFTREMIDVLRPATPGAIKPHEIPDVIGKRALHDLPFGKELRWTDLGV